RKEIFIMSRVEGLQAKEIAEKLGLSVHTVNKHIALALSMLKEKMGDFLPIVLALLYFDRIW
ncbi:MAG: HTH domain-containing protein, partial [Spirochaetales bacterium]|nr:HTH domain-containing protein [Spirochaetales bacterium]